MVEMDAQREYEDRIHNIIIITVNALSIIASSIVLTVVGIIKLRVGDKIPRRASYQLVVWITIIDLIYSAFHILCIYWPEGGIGCTLGIWGYLFSSLSTVFLTGCIALNLQLVILHHYTLGKKVQNYYCLAATSMALLITSVPLIYGKIGFDNNAVSCWYINEHQTEAIIWEFATYYGWILAAILYCSIISVLIIHRMWTKLSYLKKYIKEEHVGYRVKKEKQIEIEIMSTSIRRIILYPIVPLITISFTLISSIHYFYYSKWNLVLFIFALIGRGSQGLINALIFLFDPVVSFAFAYWRRYMLTKYYPSIQVEPDSFTRFGISEPKFSFSENYGENDQSNWFIRAFIGHFLLNSNEKSQLKFSNAHRFLDCSNFVFKRRCHPLTDSSIPCLNSETRDLLSSL